MAGTLDSHIGPIFGGHGHFQVKTSSRSMRCFTAQHALRGLGANSYVSVPDQVKLEFEVA